MNKFRVGDWGYTPWYIRIMNWNPNMKYRRKLSYKGPKGWEHIWEYM